MQYVSSFISFAFASSFMIGTSGSVVGLVSIYFSIRLKHITFQNLIRIGKFKTFSAWMDFMDLHLSEAEGDGFFSSEERRL